MNIGLTRDDSEKQPRGDGERGGRVGRVTDMLPCTALILNYHRGEKVSEAAFLFGFFSSCSRAREAWVT